MKTHTGLEVAENCLEYCLTLEYCINSPGGAHRSVFEYDQTDSDELRAKIDERWKVWVNQ